MRLFSFILCVCLSSCAPFVRVTKDGSVTISQGFAAKVAGAATKVKTADGLEITQVTKGFNGTEVLNTAIMAGGAAYAAGASAAVAKAREVTSQNATTQAASVTKADIAAKAATEQASIAAKGAATSEAINAGAQVTPVTITPP